MNTKLLTIFGLSVSMLILWILFDAFLIIRTPFAGIVHWIPEWLLFLYVGYFAGFKKKKKLLVTVLIYVVVFLSLLPIIENFTPNGNHVINDSGNATNGFKPITVPVPIGIMVFAIPMALGYYAGYKMHRAERKNEKPRDR
jgi:hypothetical protein